MDRVEEIEAAITSLPPEEYQRIVDWFRAREQTRWDEQVDRDSAAGKLDLEMQDFLRGWLNELLPEGYRSAMSSIF